MTKNYVYTNALKPLMTRELQILSRSKISSKVVKLFGLTKREDTNLPTAVVRAMTNTPVIDQNRKVIK
jgi:hypothetical protein